MQTSSWRCAFWLAITGLSLAACTSSPTPPSSGLTPNAVMNDARHSVPLHRRSDAFIGVRMVGAVHPDHHKSWVSPDVRRAKRLYFASDVWNDDVYIFTLPGMALKGVLTGFNEPQGECADKAGNIWVANSNTEQMFELSRTGSIINTINDTYGAPVSCAINPKNGAMAVTDFWGTSGAGQVLIYATPSSTPTILANPSQYNYFFDGYDSAGNLWTDGLTYGGSYILSACGKSSCSTISLSGTIYYPGAVEWDNVARTWVVFDQLCDDTFSSCSYPVSGSGKLGTPTNYLNSSGANVCDLVQGTIAANSKYLVGGDYTGTCYGDGHSGNYDRWAYPAGGKPSNATADGPYVPVGAAISVK